MVDMEPLGGTISCKKYTTGWGGALSVYHLATDLFLTLFPVCECKCIYSAPRSIMMLPLWFQSLKLYGEINFSAFGNHVFLEQ